MNAKEIERTVWDVIIVGTGMGGATLGFALARSGRRVLFVEKGRSHLSPSGDAIQDKWAEAYGDAWRTSGQQQRDIFARAGRCTDQIEDHSQKQTQHFTPLIGSGTGGSSALYAAALERFFPADFHPRQHYRDVDGTSLPESWPIDYDDLSKWYAEAERLYRVRGGVDPLRPHDDCAALVKSSPWTPGNAELSDFLQGKGLNPYPLHVGVEDVPDCSNCVGHLCSRSCKNDSARICLAPAIQEHGAKLLAECRVLHLEADRTRVNRVICEWQGSSLALKSRLVVLAAGALVTPVILLQSTSTDWPQGLSNRSGLVGCNLMRHCAEFFIVRTKTLTPTAGNSKQLGFNDFYFNDGWKLGTVQSLGPLPPHQFFLAQHTMVASLLRWTRPFFAPLWNKVQSRYMPIASIMEDLPYSDNRVQPVDGSKDSGQQKLRLAYRLRESDLCRLRMFRAQINEAFRPYRLFWSKSGTDNRGLAHACGTCRFGHDPQTSVLNSNNRSHDVGNLYVADSSFFPSSAGINPSLTIAANALRIAPELDAQLQAGG